MNRPNQPDEPKIVDWSKSVSPQAELIEIPEEYALSSELDPNEYKYIAIKFYSKYIDEVFYSKYPFYVEYSYGVYMLRRAAGDLSWSISSRGQGFASANAKYNINGIPYGGNNNSFNTKAGVVNYPLLAVDAEGNIL